MSDNTGSALPIKLVDLRPYAKHATDFLTSVSYAPRKSLAAFRAELGTRDQQMAARVPFSTDSFETGPRAETFSILTIAKGLNGGDELLPENVSAVLNAVRTGMEVAFYVAGQYGQFSGLDSLAERNRQGQLKLDSEKADLIAKRETQSAITVYVTARYVLWKLAAHEANEHADVPVDFPGLPESVALNGQVRALSALIFHWGSFLKEVSVDVQVPGITKRYFEEVLKQVVARSDSFRATECFTDNTYKLDDTEFIIRGFTDAVDGAGGVVEFKPTRMEEVTGNHEAKRLVQRLAQFLIAYDFERGKNPFMELEAFPWLFLLEGYPGTGKTMLLRVLQTLARDYCENLDIPFQIVPIPNGIVQSLQGESANTYQKWWARSFNPKFLTIAPVDDAEAVYLDRRDHSSSEGSKLIVMAHLRLTEGSTALIRGNTLQAHATNNADTIDPAVFSRYVARVRVPGAESREDYDDQMKLWGDRVNAAVQPNPALIDLSFPEDYKFLSAQGFTPPDEREQRGEAFVQFKDKELARIWDEVRGLNLPHDSYDLYGRFFALLHGRFGGRFTSRDVRNITTNATSRLFGFDFPSEWLEKRDVFVGKDFDTKKAMILERALEFQGGLAVKDVLFQEMVHYVGTTIAMLESGRKARIRQLADAELEHRAALELVNAEAR